MAAVTIEFRTVSGALRSTKKGIVEMRAVSYNALDMFGTVWLPGCFTDWLNRSRVTILYAHDDVAPPEPIGKMTSWQDTPTGPVITARLDTSPDVPRARQAIAQIDSGTLDEVSVGFRRVPGGTLPPDAADEKRYGPKIREKIAKAEMSHLAIVYEGAVPGAKVLSLRGSGRESVLDQRVDDALRKVRMMQARDGALPRWIDTDDGDLDELVDDALDIALRSGRSWR